MNQTMGKRVVIFGASRGMGLQLAAFLLRHDEHLRVLSISRFAEESLSQDLLKPFTHRIRTANIDFADSASAKEAYNQLILFRPHQFFYFAKQQVSSGFFRKDWSDNENSVRVNFLFPAELLSLMLKDWQRFHDLKQMLFATAADANSNTNALEDSSRAGLFSFISKIRTLPPMTADIRLFCPAPTVDLTQKLTDSNECNMLLSQLLSCLSDTGLRNLNFQLK